MVNLIGAEPAPRDVLALPGAHLHRYGKTAHTDRKLGHITVVGADEPERDARMAAVRRVLVGDSQAGVIAIRRAMRSSVAGWVENSRAMSTPWRG